MEERAGRLNFEEEQRFPLWIKAVALLPVVILAVPVILLWFAGSRVAPGVLIFGAALAVLFLPLAALHFVIKLVTTVDSDSLRVRIYPLKWSLLPRRMTQKDIAFNDIERCDVRTYNSLRSSEFWGWHLWGLSAAKGGRYLYVMRPSSLVSARGVHLQLRSGESLLIGSKHPDELLRAITQACT